MNERIEEAGARFLVGFPGLSIPGDFRLLVREYKLGNYILFQENIQSEEQLGQLCRELTALSLEETGSIPLIAVDQEGGRVQRLPKELLDTPSARALAQTGRVEAAFAAGERIGRTLRRAGVNFDLAPVMDVESVGGNPAVGDRSFGTDTETVCRFGCAMIRGLRAGGVLTCAKHFPGHGGTKTDTHTALPMIFCPLEELEAGSLIPFRQAMAAGVSAMMTTHIIFEQMDGALPATLSAKAIGGLLRQKMGYGGLVLTDCLEMEAIASQYGVAEAAVLSAGAGADMMTMSHDAAAAATAAVALVHALEQKKISKGAHGRSIERIQEAKLWLNM